MGRVKLKSQLKRKLENYSACVGKGVASTRSGYAGDLICRIAVETPVNLTSEQKELLQKLGEKFTR